MKIPTNRKLQYTSSLMALKFIWRHALTLGLFAIIVHGICMGGTPIIGKIILFFIGAASIDWLKVKWFKWLKKQEKSYPRYLPSSSSFEQPIHIQQWTNPSVIGTSAHNLNNLGHRH